MSLRLSSRLGYYPDICRNSSGKEEGARGFKGVVRTRERARYLPRYLCMGRRYTRTCHMDMSTWFVNARGLMNWTNPMLVTR